MFAAHLGVLCLGMRRESGRVDFFRDVGRKEWRFLLPEGWYSCLLGAALEAGCSPQ